MTLTRVGVLGAGTMGTGIAQVCGLAGLQTIMVDLSLAAVEHGAATVRASLDRLMAKGQISETLKDATLSRIRGSTSYADLSTANLVIEAVTEDVDIKLRILKQLDSAVPSDAIIATNTSSISITRLAAAVSQPHRFIGMHFFNPVPVMTLLEIVRGLRTSDETHMQAIAFAKLIGKVPITAGNGPGFAVNRILCPMINEAIFALGEGLATAADIDTAMKLGCNHPIGPLALADLIGLDTLLSVMSVFHERFNDPKYRPAPLLKELVAAGYLGRKSGQGFFKYE
jgi:3-hydroxybutyryl-CoA dehydrogenase